MIDKLVAGLPEVYQPIYGHPALSTQVSRSCADRLEHIGRTHDMLQRLLGRPLKVLDLGCAQGYFSINLAARGAIVHGVDFLDKNIAVCSALALENPDLQISFETARVEDVIAKLEPNQFDLVLGLSVFHHIAHEHGADAVKAMLELVALRSGALMVELALREEPLYWAPSQPEEPGALLENIAFSHKIANHITHLAPIARPLFVASNRYWIFADHIDKFESWSSDPHALAKGIHQGTRRYFFNSNAVLKLYRFGHPGEYNKIDFQSEIHFLQKTPPNFPAPRLIAFDTCDEGAWLLMQRLPGRLLLDMFREGISVDSRSILLGVLKQLATLEAVGLYHNDVRAWNILITEEGATYLIDYGSISNKPEDCTWPLNIFLSFLIFVREVVTRVVDDPEPLRMIAISPYRLPQPYRAWATLWWSRPLTEWSFRLLYQSMLEAPVGELEIPLQQPIEAWMKAVEEALQTQAQFTHHLAVQHADNIRQAAAKVQAAAVETHAAEAKAQAAAAETHAAEARAQAAEIKAQQANTKSLQSESDMQQAKAQYIALLGSWSWRITAPARLTADLLLHSKRTLRDAGNSTIHRAINTLQRPLSHAMRAILLRPQLGYRINKLLMRYPALHQQLLEVARKQGVLAHTAVHVTQMSTMQHHSTYGPAGLTPRARQIYAELKAAIDSYKRPD